MKRKLIGLLPLTLGLITLNACSNTKEEVLEIVETTLSPLVKLEKAELTTFTHEIRVQGNVETDKDILIHAVSLILQRLS